MKTTGKFKGVTIDIETKKKLLTFLVDYVSDDELKRLYEAEKLDIKAEIYRRKRSLSSNAYFHLLCGKIADALTISKAAAKNDMITKYGQLMYAGDDVACIKANLTIEQVREMAEPHLKFVKYNEDEDAYFYLIYRGSHTYNSKEMSVLIDGTVEEAKILGIETLPPHELERMAAMWKAKED